MQILLVEDHPVLREALRGLLVSRDPSIDVVAQVATAREAVAMVKTHRPDVVVMDLMLPGPNGVSATREIRRVAPKCRVLIFTAVTEPAFAADAFSAGAQGYALKTQGIEDLLQALGRVSRGERYVAPSLEHALLDERAKPPPRAGILAALSAREREIFDLVVAGRTNRQVGADLFISVKTVETHRARINRKLGLHSTAQLIRLAALGGLVSP
jgi:DNA-binding NarL/FixJ family response regulator